MGGLNPLSPNACAKASASAQRGDLVGAVLCILNGITVAQQKFNSSNADQIKIKIQ
jgi:hypothetical protein